MIAQAITLAAPPRKPGEASLYFAPVFYTLSGRCRVSRRGVGCIAEIRISPVTWAVIHGSAGDFEHALDSALDCDPYAVTR